MDGGSADIAGANICPSIHGGRISQRAMDGGVTHTQGSTESHKEPETAVLCFPK